jgi:NADH-quinone oxidoreductase subunit C
MAKQDEIFPIIKEKFGGGILEEHPEVLDPYLVFEPGIIRDLALFCRDDARLRFDLLSVISTVDYLPVAASPDGKTPAKPGRIEVVYVLDSTVHHHRLIAKAFLDRESPRIASVENVWHAADWHEREAFDLMGVIFEGHHNLVRILCAEDWEGHALRKDYVIPETYHGIKNVIY